MCELVPRCPIFREIACSGGVPSRHHRADAHGGKGKRHDADAHDQEFSDGAKVLLLRHRYSLPAQIRDPQAHIRLRETMLNNVVQYPSGQIHSVTSRPSASGGGSYGLFG